MKLKDLMMNMHASIEQIAIYSKDDKKDIFFTEENISEIPEELENSEVTLFDINTVRGLKTLQVMLADYK